MLKSVRLRETVAVNGFPAMAAIGVLIVGLALGIAIKADRAKPVLFVQATISPDPAIVGAMVNVRWTDVWYRRCEGELSRQIVSSDGVIHAYRKHIMRIPVDLGQQQIDIPFFLPRGIPAGETIYQAVVRFNNCGITSRWWPLEVSVPSLTFDVTR
jgi:hypothetical protein